MRRLLSSVAGLAAVLLAVGPARAASPAIGVCSFSVEGATATLVMQPSGTPVWSDSHVDWELNNEGFNPSAIVAEGHVTDMAHERAIKWASVSLEYPLTGPDAWSRGAMAIELAMVGVAPARVADGMLILSIDGREIFKARPSRDMPPIDQARLTLRVRDGDAAAAALRALDGGHRLTITFSAPGGAPLELSVNLDAVTPRDRAMREALTGVVGAPGGARGGSCLR